MIRPVMSVEIDSDTGELRKSAKLRRVGGSTVVTIPHEIAEQLRAAEGDEVQFAVQFGETDRATLRVEHESED